MIDRDAAETLRIIAGTHAAWLKDNREVCDLPDDERYPMWVMATGFMRLYYECIEAGIIKLNHGSTH